jgi:hypothetical protein
MYPFASAVGPRRDPGPYFLFGLSFRTSAYLGSRNAATGLDESASAILPAAAGVLAACDVGQRKPCPCVVSRRFAMPVLRRRSLDPKALIAASAQEQVVALIATIATNRAECGAGKTRRPKAVGMVRGESMKRRPPRNSRRLLLFTLDLQDAHQIGSASYSASDTADGFRSVQSLLVIGVTATVRSSHLGQRFAGTITVTGCYPVMPRLKETIVI